MKYEKCPICEEKLRNGVCPMCGYDFNRLGRSRILKDGHWDILTLTKRLLSQNISMMKNDIQILKILRIQRRSQ